MHTYTAQVVACEAYRGDPNDKLIWHFLVEAKTPAEAERIMRASPHPERAGRLVPEAARIAIYEGRLLG